MSKNGQFTHQAVSDFLNQKLSRKETAELLQVRERTVTRMARRNEGKGLFGVIHGNRERPPSNKKSESLRKAVMDLVEEKYFDFNMIHCLEVLKASHGIEVKYATFRRWCHDKHLVKRRKRGKGVARNRRTRMRRARGFSFKWTGVPTAITAKTSGA